MFGRPLRAGFRAAPLGGRGPIRTIRGDGRPSWWRNAAAGQWVAISGTALAGSAAEVESKGVATVSAYNGMAFNESTGDIVLLANGGHGDSSVNAVQSININQDAPSWSLRTAATSGGSRVSTGGSGYNSDGLPRSRHTYSSSQWIAQRDRYMNFGARFMSTDASSAAVVDGWDPGTDTWDAAGTWANAAGWGAGTCKDPDTGNVYTCSGYYYFHKWTQATDSWSTSASGLEVYGPLVFDPVRQIVVSFAWGDNVGSGSGANLVKCNADLTGKTAITINASAAYSAWQTAAPYTPALVYDVVGDRYLLYAGNSGATQTVFVITPNSGSTWDMELLSTSGATPPACVSGCNNKFAYFPSLDGCVLLAAGNQDIHFLRLR